MSDEMRGFLVTLLTLMDLFWVITGVEFGSLLLIVGATVVSLIILVLFFRPR